MLEPMLAERPNLPSANYGSALALRALGDNAGALAAMARAALLGGADHRAQLAHAQLLARHGQWSEALEACDRSLARAPMAAALHGGAALERIGRTANLRIIQGPELRTIYLGMDQMRPELLKSDVRGRNPFQDVRVGNRALPVGEARPSPHPIRQEPRAPGPRRFGGRGREVASACAIKPI